MSRTPLPSPALVVAIIALIVALSGTAVAAVNYARNAGAVDGKSAVASGATLKSAAGRLVATQRSGADRGRIAAKYLDLGGRMRGATASFGRFQNVIDNQSLTPVPLGEAAGLGTLQATCADENGAGGRLDPVTTLTFANTSGEAVNLSRNVGFNAGTNVITVLQNGTTHQIKVSGSQAFQLHVERRGANWEVRGVVRQDGRDTPTASCLVYGYALLVPGG
jgi:hypothetical protein